MSDVQKAAAYASQADKAFLRTQALAAQAAGFVRATQTLKNEVSAIKTLAERALESVRQEFSVELDHEWDGTSLRIRRPDGEWGPYVNLIGPSTPAGEIEFAPGSGIIADNVQAAILEAYSESARATHGHVLADITDIDDLPSLLGLGDLAAKDTVNNDDWSGAALAVEHGGTGGTTPETARAGLELGSAAILDHGTDAGDLVRLDPTTAKLPAVDGSLLTNLPVAAPSLFKRDISGTASLTTADKGKVIQITGAVTVTADAAATLGDGWWCVIKQISGFGSLVLGGTTYLVSPLENGFIVTCDGAAFRIVGRPSRILLSRAVASNNATIDFVSGIGTAFRNYEVEITNATPATDNVALWMRTSTDAGANWDAGASDYAYGVGLFRNSATGNVNDNSTGAAQIRLDGGYNLQTDANCAGWSGKITIFKPSAAQYCLFGIEGSFSRTPLTDLARVQGTAVRGAAADVTGLRFMMSSGNVASGEFDLYGVL